MRSRVQLPYEALIALSVGIFLSLVLAPQAARADSTAHLSVAPAVIDEKVSARDILNKTIKIINTSGRKLQLYPSVNDVNPQEGMQEFQYAGNSNDRSHSLANWIELSRGVIELNPGEERDVPFVIRAHLDAPAQTYHAQIIFYEGANREVAQTASAFGVVTLNIEVKADIKEIMQLNKFSTDSVVFTGDDIVFKYQVQNIGNQELKPSGEIAIFNRRGEEIASVDVNKDGKVVTPDQMTQLASVWSGVTGFGRFKALLTVQYGSQTAAVTDTVYFWVIPWKQLLGLFIVSIIAVIFFALYFQRWFEDWHLHRLAHAGYLKHEVATQILPPAPSLPATIPAQISHAPLPAAAPAPLPAAVRRSWWPLSKKGAREAPAPGPAPVFQNFVSPPAQSAPAPVQKRSLREAMIAHEQTSAHGSTIDLKSLHERKKAQEAAASESQGHVIDLKKPR